MVDDLPSTERPAAPVRRSFRWRLIPATILFILGPHHSLMSVLLPLQAVYVLSQDGWTDPRLPRYMQPTLESLSFWQLSFWMGVLATGSAFAWLYGRWYIAWGTTGLVVVLAVIRSVLFPP